MTENATGTPDNDLLQRLVETVVQTADPDRVILFGSAARGEPTSAYKSSLHRTADGSGDHESLSGVGV